MKCLWLIFVLPTVFAQVGFGRSYLRNSRLCRQWQCLNKKLGLPDELPPRDQYSTVLKGLLPSGAWQEAADKVLDVCYGTRPRVYTNTCPGQAMLHCVVDQMVENCVEESWRKEDACSEVNSIAGFKYLFSQRSCLLTDFTKGGGSEFVPYLSLYSVYEDMEKNLPKERRPSWFMQNYFNTKCCNLPVMINASVLVDCGFTGFIDYYTHAPKYTTPLIADKFKNHLHPLQSTSLPEENKNVGDKLQVVDLAQFAKPNENTDPLDCCDMSEFIEPAWRTECGFQLSWEGQNRLVINNSTGTFTTEPTTTTTTHRTVITDLILVPESCEKETCVFRRLNIVSDSGVVDRDAYLKMLDNFTDAHPSWTNAKARVVTKCLSKPRLSDYEADCEINKILACTFDVLSENCPFARKSDACRHRKDTTGCQISSSKYRAKNRRKICLVPELLSMEHLAGCELDSIRRAEHVTVEMPLPRKHGWMTSKYMCKDLTQPTKCVLSKMGVLNKYNFMDYFQMKDRIRRFASRGEWAALTEVYLSAFTNVPMYREHCSSSKKLLNVVDTMLMTCPVSKRRNTTQCTNIFDQITNTSPVNTNITKGKHDEILKHFTHLFIAEAIPTPKFSWVIRHRQPTLLRKPLYNYGLLNNGNSPAVNLLNVKSNNTKLLDQNKPLVLLPMYLRQSKNAQTPFNDGVFRGHPFGLHSRIANAHNSTISPEATVRSVLATDTPVNRGSHVEMMKP